MVLALECRQHRQHSGVKVIIGSCRTRGILFLYFPGYFVYLFPFSENYIILPILLRFISLSGSANGLPRTAVWHTQVRREWLISPRKQGPLVAPPGGSQRDGKLPETPGPWLRQPFQLLRLVQIAIGVRCPGLFYMRYKEALLL